MDPGEQTNNKLYPKYKTNKVKRKGEISVVKHTTLLKGTWSAFDAKQATTVRERTSATSIIEAVTSTTGKSSSTIKNYFTAGGVIGELVKITGGITNEKRYEESCTNSLNWATTKSEEKESTYVHETNIKYTASENEDMVVYKETMLFDTKVIRFSYLCVRLSDWKDIIKQRTFDVELELRYEFQWYKVQVCIGLDNWLTNADNTKPSLENSINYNDSQLWRWDGSQLVSKSGYYLDVSENSEQDKALVIMSKDSHNDRNSQIWNCVKSRAKNDDDYDYLIRNGNGCYLGPLRVPKGRALAPMNLVQYYYNDRSEPIKQENSYLKWTLLLWKHRK